MHARALNDRVKIPAGIRDRFCQFLFTLSTLGIWYINMALPPPTSRAWLNSGRPVGQRAEGTAEVLPFRYLQFQIHICLPDYRIQIIQVGATIQPVISFGLLDRHVGLSAA